MKIKLAFIFVISVRTLSLPLDNHLLKHSSLCKISNTLQVYAKSQTQNCIPLVTIDVVRGYLHKSLFSTVEFIIESEKASLPNQPVSLELVIFYITQDTQRHSLLHELRYDIYFQNSLLYPSMLSIFNRVQSFDRQLLKLNPKSDPRTPRLNEKCTIGTYSNKVK
ncbi:hypothetical protein LOK49_LG04G00439 [Camellia lanceoleosa]|uniref:Uncharacterized protein n=1 Tax=Camellia lanceoleosa TaxID=1840588 RepID=A0ACC0I2I9_9ERIC|nr:hypothetical protein LOK49_LG04G00439 [Camellia lanceoleosa]